jgi:uncharacterized protein (TIGR03118 family)
MTRTIQHKHTTPLYALALASLASCAPGTPTRTADTSDAVSSGYHQTNLVADTAGSAKYVDAHLIDPWGMLLLPNCTLAVVNAHSGFGTQYTAGGRPLSPVVTVPTAPGVPPPGLPTGLVANTTDEFVISENGRSAPAVFLTDTLDGTISGWSPAVDPQNAVIAVDNSAESPFAASYTGMAIARNSHGQTILYAADSGNGPTLSNNRVDMFDGRFNRVGSFTDPHVPSGLTVFNVQLLAGRLYVTFAAFSPGLGGVVDIFDTDGHLLERFAKSGSSGPLNGPWAFAQAPAGWGSFGGALLIGNFYDGIINAYDAESRAFLGQLSDGTGQVLTSGLGLWTLAFGTESCGSANRLFFDSGVNNESDGLLGYIQPN